MQKSTNTNNYYITPIKVTTNISKDIELTFIDTRVNECINGKMKSLPSKELAHIVSFFSYIDIVKKNIDPRKKEYLDRYLNTTKDLNLEINTSSDFYRYCDTFEESVIRPILKNNYQDFKISSDFYKFKKYVTKNTVLLETVIMPYFYTYYDIVKDMADIINSMDVTIVTNFSKIKKLFPNKNIIMYNDITKVEISNNILFLDLPFNINTVMATLDNKYNRNFNLYYLDIENTANTLLDRNIDIIKKYNILISKSFEIELSFMSKVFNTLIGEHCKPNIFLSESNTTGILKSWVKNI